MSMEKEIIQCGLDEAGRGPVIGPMVIAMVCGFHNDLAHLGVRDSKVLTPRRREDLAGIIYRSAISVNFVEVTPKDLNELMQTLSLNEIELRGYAELIAKSPKEATVLVDSFDIDTIRLQNRLREMTGRRVYCHHHADRDYPSVSAASIIAKVVRDREIEKLKVKYGNIGSGYPSDPVTVSFLKQAIQEGIDIQEIVRVKWKTFQRMIVESKNRKLF
ncbi:MAG: ribonuclease HII [Thermoplasmataceae archaeon]